MGAGGITAHHCIWYTRVRIFFLLRQGAGVGRVQGWKEVWVHVSAG